MRRNTIECLEEETIKNSKLRFRMCNLPGEIAAEMTGSTSLTSSVKRRKLSFLCM